MNRIKRAVCCGVLLLLAGCSALNEPNKTQTEEPYVQMSSAVQAEEAYELRFFDTRDTTVLLARDMVYDGESPLFIDAGLHTYTLDLLAYDTETDAYQEVLRFDADTYCAQAIEVGAKTVVMTVPREEGENFFELKFVQENDKVLFGGAYHVFQPPRIAPLGDDRFVLSYCDYGTDQNGELVDCFFVVEFDAEGNVVREVKHPVGEAFKFLDTYLSAAEHGYAYLGVKEGVATCFAQLEHGETFAYALEEDERLYSYTITQQGLLLSLSNVQREGEYYLLFAPFDGSEPVRSSCNRPFFQLFFDGTTVTGVDTEFLLHRITLAEDITLSALSAPPTGTSRLFRDFDLSTYQGGFIAYNWQTQETYQVRVS